MTETCGYHGIVALPHLCERCDNEESEDCDFVPGQCVLHGGLAVMPEGFHDEDELPF